MKFGNIWFFLLSIIFQLIKKTMKEEDEKNKLGVNFFEHYLF